MMVFSSLEFIYLFLFPTLMGYIVLRHFSWEKGIIWWLIIASLVFYAWWSVLYLVLLLTSVIGNFVLHQFIKRSKSKVLLAIGTTANLGALAYFKYADFFIENINALTYFQLPLLHVILPLAISFFTFQQISFLFDTYHGKVEQCDFAKYCLFVVFFPQLIAGPIVLQKHTLPQFTLATFRKPLYMNIAIGLTLFSIGLFKKIVFADTMASTANEVFALVHAGNTVPFEIAWLGVLAYSFQIYFDFSGYCDMALGLARMFGIRLPINFNSPYQALNIVDFWRRWHITLSSFLRDYLYIPFGGSRKGKPRQYLNLMATMLLGGLWHGASWNFVFWGFLHGMYLAINHGWNALTTHLKLPSYFPAFIGRGLSHLITMLAVLMAWVFFRAENFSDAILLIKAMFGQTYFYNIKLWADVLNEAPSLWLKIAFLSFVVVFLPNSIELTKNYRPVIKVKKYLSKGVGLSENIRKWLVWRPTITWSIAISFITTMSFYYLYQANNITEFIYFNF